MLIAVDEVVALVFPVKVALVAPAGMVTVEGTVARAVLLLASETMAPLCGAGELSITLPVNGDPPTTLLGLSVSDVRVGPGGGNGVTVSTALSCWAPPPA